MQQIDINIFTFIKSIQNHFKLFICVNVIAVIIALIVAFVLPVYYESKAVFYPYSPEGTDPRNFLFEDIQLYTFSNSDQSSIFINLANSKAVRMGVINKLHLDKKYHIDTTQGPDRILHLLKTLEGNVRIKKEENGAIAVYAQDKSKDTAALIANQLVYEIEKTYQSSIKEKNKKIYDVYATHYQKAEQYLTALKDSLTMVKSKTKNFNAENEVYFSKQIEYAMEEYNKTRFLYEKASAMMSHDLRAIYLAEPAQPVLKKASPKRLYIILFTGVISGIVSILLLAGYDFYRSSQNYLKS